MYIPETELEIDDEIIEESEPVLQEDQAFGFSINLLPMQKLDTDESLVGWSVEQSCASSSERSL
jgi:hypothetical protein